MNISCTFMVLRFFARPAETTGSFHIALSGFPRKVLYDMQDGMGGVTDLMLRWAKEEMCGASSQIN